MLSDKALSDYRTKLAAMTETELLRQIYSNEQDQARTAHQAMLANDAAQRCAIRAALAKLALSDLRQKGPTHAPRS